MKRIIYILVVLLTYSTIGQTTTENYVKTVTARQEATSIINSESYGLTKQSIQYFDGLGRLKQSVTRWGTHDVRDYILPVDYDAFGRQQKTYLPYEKIQSSGAFSTNALNEQNAFYDGHYGGNSGSYAFSETRFQDSPLNRVLEQAAPGYSWRMNGGATVTSGYELNGTSEVKLWQVDGLQASSQQFFPANELHKSITTDEDGNQTIEYSNKIGQTILKSSYTGTEWAETYYIYDDFGRLTFVLPPQANKAIEDYYDGLVVEGYIVKTGDYTLSSGEATAKVAYSLNGTITIPAGVTLTPGAHIKTIEVLTPDFLNTWAFQYEYDDRGRMISKQVPGADPVYMVYDKWDRLVLTQDGNQRSSNEWLFTKYDAFNRPVMTGKKVITGDLQTVRNAVSASTNRFETHNSGSLEGYSNSTYPSSGVSSADLLTVTYYDDYSFVSSSDLNGTSFQSVYTTSDAFHILPVYNANVKGQVTGVLTRGDGSDFITTITYYDEKYRPIQIVSENHLGGTDRVSNQYDFVGNIRKTQTAHSDGTTTTTIKRRFTYDHQDRLLNTYHQIDNETEILISQNDYNHLGELEMKDLHSGEQEVDYTYNIRGWLTAINQSNLSSSNDLFGMELHYNDNPIDGTNEHFNGNISAMRWSDYTATGSNAYRSYNYEYDGLNRLTDADHYVGGSNALAFDVDNLQYDLNGNIESLTRRSETSSMDNLSYSYEGNRLRSVTDTGDDNEGFVDGNTSGDDYFYDANGNMIGDANKGITNIEYNHLNLPTKVTFNASNYIEYLYDAAGIKLQQKVYKDGALSKTTDYVGEFIYEDGNLELIQQEEGRIIPLDASHPEFISGSKEHDYQYHLKDHLGNVRLTFSTTPQVYTMYENYEDANSDFQDLKLQQDQNLNVTTPYGSNDQVSKVSSNETSSMIFLSVNKGDDIDMQVEARYNNHPSGNTFVETSFNALFSSFDQSFGSGAEGGVTTTSTEFSDALSSVDMSKDELSLAPRAYINYILFDLDMNYVKAGYTQIGTGAYAPATTANHSMTVSRNDVIPEQDGYIFIYLSNENQEAVDIFFDEMTVTQTKTNVVSAQDYYPFGLTFNERTRVASSPQNFQYNGKETIEEWGVIDYGARMYMPDIGRWGVIDQMTESMYSHSPYAYALNNPANVTDRDGNCPDGVDCNKVVNPIANMQVRDNRASNLDIPSRVRTNGTTYTHEGWDIRASSGTNVQSIYKGKVVDVYTDETSNQSYGTSITVAHYKDGTDEVAFYSFYSHLSGTDVSVDDTVEAGDILGQSGTTGNADDNNPSQEHLHFEVGTEIEETPAGRQAITDDGRISPNEVLPTTFKKKGTGAANVSGVVSTEKKYNPITGKMENVRNYYNYNRGQNSPPTKTDSYDPNEEY